MCNLYSITTNQSAIAKRDQRTSMGRRLFGPPTHRGLLRRCASLTASRRNSCLAATLDLISARSDYLFLVVERHETWQRFAHNYTCQDFAFLPGARSSADRKRFKRSALYCGPTLLSRPGRPSAHLPGLGGGRRSRPDYERSQGADVTVAKNGRRRSRPRGLPQLDKCLNIFRAPAGWQRRLKPWNFLASLCFLIPGRIVSVGERSHEATTPGQTDFPT
ncbi:hypothetical protein ABIF14_003623 [Bradyrhizobium elkanii]